MQLKALIEEALILVQTSGVQARIDFSTQFDAELPAIVADRELLKQVLLNLLINAVQAIGARGEIRIRTWRDTSTHLALTIEDNGCGIDSDVQKDLRSVLHHQSIRNWSRAGAKPAHYQRASGRYPCG